MNCLFTIVDVLIIGQWKSTYLSTAVWLVDVDVVVVPCSAMLKHIKDHIGNKCTLVCFNVSCLVRLHACSLIVCHVFL